MIECNAKPIVNQKLRYQKIAIAIKFTLAGSLSAVLMASSLNTYAAAEQSYHFMVSAGSLEQGLLTIARESNQTISFTPSLVKGMTTKSLQGNFTTQQILLKILQGHPLTLSHTSNGTLTIETLQTSMPASSAEQAAVNNGLTLPTITVSDSNSTGDYINQTDSSTVTRSDTPLQQVPQSVSVVTSKAFEAQQAQTLSDVLRNVSGVVSNASTPQGGPNYYIRGYEAQNILSDGLATPTGSFQNIDGIQSVEVVKGPSAILSGQASPGGSINIVRKKPTKETIHNIQMEYGSNAHLKTALDLGGKVDDYNNLTYRLNLSWTDGAKGNGSYYPERGKYIAPALNWTDDRTNITVGGEYFQQRNPMPAYTYAQWTGGYNDPDLGWTGSSTNGKPVNSSRKAIGPTNSRLEAEGGNVYYDLEEKLNNHLTFHSKAQFMKQRDNLSFWALQSAPGQYTPDNQAVLNPYASSDDNQSLSFDNYLQSKFSTGIADHEVTLGWNLSNMKYRGYTPGNMAALIPDYNIDVNDASSVPPIDAQGPFTINTQKVRQSGIYLQEQLTLAKKLHFLTSIRNTQYWGRSSNHVWEGDDLYQDYNSEAHASAWTPAFGIAYDLTPWMTAYVNYLKGFNTATLGEVDSSGKMIPPSEDKQLEAGTKFSFLDDNLTLTTSLFRIQRSNVATAAGFDDSGNQYYTVSSGQESKGFEIDLSGSPLPGWNITGNYTWQETWQPGASDYIVPAQAKHTANLWTSYEIQSGMLRGWNSSIGLNARSKMYAGTNNGLGDDVFLPGQLRTDVSVGYRSTHNWSANLGVKNVFNKQLYLPSSSGSSYIPLDVERTYMFTVDYQF